MALPDSTQPPQAADVSTLFNLRDRTALITGATGHLGSALAAALAEAGASVIVSSRRGDDAKKSADALPRVRAATHHGVELDHMDESSLHQGFHAALKIAGKLDILVCNGHEPLADDWRTVTAEQFTRHQANATGYFMLARRFREHVVARKGRGSIVLLGSMYGVVGSYPDAYEGIAPASPVAYHMLKGGIVQMTRHLAVYWAKDGIRVNCLSPGPFPKESAPREMVERLIARSPMGRMGRPQELKGAMVFLAGDASSYMTGQNLLIDGGWTAW